MPLYTNRAPREAHMQKGGDHVIPSFLSLNGLLEVTLQQALESLAVTGLVPGHLSRRRAGRFASYGALRPYLPEL